jgi:cobalamin biosynthesis protein CobT
MIEKNTKGAAKMKQTRTMETKWEKIARVFSKRATVHVNTKTLNCTTDGNTIYLPANADKFKGEDQAVMEGLLDHEWGHVEQEEIYKAKGQTTPLQFIDGQTAKYKAVFNALEDNRIERGLSARYPGVATNLQAMNKKLVGDLIREMAANIDKVNPNYIITIGISFRAVRIDTSWMPESYNIILDGLQAEISQVNRTETPAEVDELTRKIITRLGNMKDELGQNQGDGDQEQGDKEQGNTEQDEQGQAGDEGDEEQEQDGSGQAGDEGDEEQEQDGEAGQDSDQDSDQEQDGEAGQDSVDGDAGEEQDSDQEQDGEADSNQAQSGQGQGQDSDQDGEADSDDGDNNGTTDGLPQATQDAKDILERVEKEQPKQTETDLMDRIKQEMSDKAINMAGRSQDHIPHPMAMENDVWDKQTHTSPEDTYLEGYARMKQDAGKAVGALKSKLSTLLRIKAQSVRIGDQEQGQIDPSALYSAKTGNKRVFSQVKPGQKLDVAVSILVDQSGSMGGRENRIGHAKVSMVAIAEALNSLGINFEVCGHHTKRFGVGLSERQIQGQMKYYNRFVGVVHYVHKGFGEKLNATAKTRIAAMETAGCNVDSEAIMHTAKRLAAQPQQRKVLIVLSDGKPNVSIGDNHKQCQATKDVVKQVSDAGIEVYGLGIQTDHVRNFYPDWDVVNNVDEMPARLFKMIRKYLMAA